MAIAWIDTHCHLDAPEFGSAGDADAMRNAARAAGVRHCVLPAVEAANWGAVRGLAHRWNDSYCLGIHPLYVPQASDADLKALQVEIEHHRNDPRLVAVGEIGLDFFVPSLCSPAMREKQERFYCAQLQLAAQAELPVVLHVRRSADRLLKYLRALRPVSGWRGIAHAFNGSFQQAQTFIEMGFALGFGGALTFDRALQLRRLAKELPLSALVLETDAPDIPPHWIYKTQSERQSTQALTSQSRNEPAQLPRIGAVLAALRSVSASDIAQATLVNAQRVLPQLQFFETL
jgi:TatD DNase family protein